MLEGGGDGGRGEQGRQLRAGQALDLGQMLHEQQGSQAARRHGAGANHGFALPHHRPTGRFHQGAD